MVVRDPALPDRSAEALSVIPSLFGRLVYLSSLRDPDTGRYHVGNSANASATEEVLRSCHAKVFADWLCLGLEQQMADLKRYLDGLEMEIPSVLSSWERQAPYQNLLPESASEEERKIYMSDFRTLLGLLKQEQGTA